jgi:acetyl esterase/lipase
MRRTALLLLAATVMSSSQTRKLTASDVPKLPAAAPKARIPYGPSPQQYADLRLPQGKGLFPVVVILHGGCWIQYASADYTAPMASALTGEGWATWNVEYRRASDSGGGWPGTFLDTGHAIDMLRGAAKQYPLDLDRVILAGHSAGGQLALWAAARERSKSPDLHFENPVPVRGALSIGGVVDLRAFAKRPRDSCTEGLLKLMGGTPAQHPERYAAVSPFDLLPLHVPHSLVWGAQDTIVPESMFSAYELSAGRDLVETITAPNAAHHELCAPSHPAFQKTVAAIRRLLQ